MKRKTAKKKKVTPCKAIRLKCRECTCNSTKAIRRCTHKKCPLFRFRYGTNPNRKKVIPYSARPYKKTISRLWKLFGTGDL